MIARIFQIVGALAILLALFIVIVVLYFLNKGLKGLNKAIESGKGTVRKTSPPPSKGWKQHRSSLAR